MKSSTIILFFFISILTGCSSRATTSSNRSSFEPTKNVVLSRCRFCNEPETMERTEKIEGEIIKTTFYGQCWCKYF